MGSLIPIKTCKLSLWGFSVLVLFICANLTAQDYFPLAVGNMWVYEVKQGDSTFIDTCVISGTSSFKEPYTYVYKTSKELFFLKKEGHTVLVYFLGQSYPCTLLVTPLEVGKCWRYGERFRVKVESKETVSVSIVTFTCYKLNFYFVEGDSEKLCTTLWVAPSVGIVKQFSIEGEGRILKDYKIKQ